MQMWLKAATIGCAVMAASAPLQATVVTPARAAVDELLAADRMFSAKSANTDLVSGLSAMFDDKVVMPAASGLAIGEAAVVAALKANAANQGVTADWTPVRGGISADGQHGFTFGYMTIRKRGAADRQAKYLSYWVKTSEGWRVAAYKRAPKPAGQGTAPMEPLVPATLVSPAKDPALVERLGRSLAAAEKGFSDEAQKIGLGAAFSKHGRADAMNMGREAGFTIGAEAIGGGFGPETVSPLNWSADGVLVASSGDLGVTWGTIRTNAPPPEGQPAAIPFFTIWYRESASDPWRYVAE